MKNSYSKTNNHKSPITNHQSQITNHKSLITNHQSLITIDMIKTNELTKIFRTEEVETTALNKVNLNVKEGEYVAVMGPSGCGKSTLLNILGLLDNPSSGSYVFNGTEVANLKERDRTVFRKGNIGFVFQSFNLIDELNVYENVELPLIYLKMKSSERKKKVEDALDRMKITHRAKHFPQQLSGGQQQRVAIARAVVANPKLILADEPTGNLDSKNGIEVINLLTELNREGTTIIMVTHSDRDAGYAHRIVNLFDGQIVS
jgi:putative ABC transport system ATP-binding protein